MMVPGKLIVKAVGANLTYDTEIFGKMDPYAIFTMGGDSRRTRTANDAGKHPVWNDIFEFNYTGQDSIQVALYDKDIGSKDDYIAETSIPILSAVQSGFVSQNFPVAHKGRPAGTIQLEIRFQPNHMGGMQQPGYGYAPQQPAYGYPPQQPGYGYPPQQPGYGYPPQQPGYGYPPQQPGYGYPPHGGHHGHHGPY